MHSIPEFDQIFQSSNFSNNHTNSTSGNSVSLLNQSLLADFNLSHLDQSAANNNGNNITNHINGTNGKEFDFSVLSSRLSSIALKSNRRRSGAVGQDGGPHYIPTPSETGRLLLFSSSFSRSNSQDPFPTIGPAQVSRGRCGAHPTLLFN